MARQKKLYGNEFDANLHLKQSAGLASCCADHRQPVRIWPYVIVAVVIGCLAGYLGSDRKGQPLSHEDAQYCDLVALNRKSPDLGWPDYQNRFDRDCNPDGSVKGAK